MNKLKRVIAVLFIVLCACMACACGASVDYMYEATDDAYVYRYVVHVDGALKSELEESATQASATARWTLDSYFSRLAYFYGMDYEYEITSTHDYKFTRTIKKDEFGPDGGETDDDTSSDDKIKVEIAKTGFFYRTIKVTEPSPFNGVVESYHDAEPGSLFYTLKNGDSTIPSLSGAFPKIADYADEEGQLKLNFLTKNSRDFITPDRVIIDGELWYKWENEFTEDEQYLVYTYRRPNPIGWYVVAMAIGAAIVTLILVLTRKSSKKPRMEKMVTGPIRYHELRAQNQNTNGVVDIYDDKPFTQYETDEQKAKRELEDMFFGNDKK